MEFEVGIAFVAMGARVFFAASAGGGGVGCFAIAVIVAGKADAWAW